MTTQVVATQRRQADATRRAALPPSITSVLYVINSFDQGGAEAGLLALVKGGVFAHCELTVLALVQGTGEIEVKLREAGVAPRILLQRTRMRGSDLPGLFRKLRAVIADVDPGVVIASLPQANLLARLAVWFSKRITFVSFEHNTRLAKRAYEIGYRLTSRRVDWAFADSATTLRDVLGRLYTREPRISRVVPLVSFPSRLAVSATQRAVGSDESFVIVNAGRFTAVKNQRALIEALATIGDSRLRLVLYGDGPLRGECERLALELGVGDRVQFPGFVGNWAERGGDLFVLASHHEGLCIVVLEAMNAGIPVVAPLIGGIRDYASEETLFAVAAVDPGTLAAVIKRAAMDGARREAVAARAAVEVGRRFGSVEVTEVYSGINRLLLMEVPQQS